jgi:hypothetical protein
LKTLQIRILNFQWLVSLFEDGDEWFQCLICKGNTAANKVDAQRHVLQQHRINLLQYNNMYHNEANWYNGSLYTCTLCNGLQFTDGVVMFHHHLNSKHKLPYAVHKKDGNLSAGDAQGLAYQVLSTLRSTDITKKSCKDTRDSLNTLGRNNTVILE